MKAKLSNIAEIRNGYQFRGKVAPAPVPANDQGVPLPEGIVRVIQIKDFDDDRRLSTADLTPVRLDSDPEKYEARQGDVLFLARGHRLFAAAVADPLEGTVATGYFFVLRPKTNDVRASYLAWYINQTPFQSVLRTFMKGTQQPLVSRKDIEDLEVEIPPLETQQAIVALEELRVKEQRLLSELREKRSQLIQSVSIKMAHDQS